MTSKKPKPSPLHPQSAARKTKASPHSRQQRASTYAELREKLRRTEEERDFYAKELTRHVMKEMPPPEVDERELRKILKHGSGVSLESLIQEIAKDAEK